jgi:hypothetical protein
MPAELTAKQGTWNQSVDHSPCVSMSRFEEAALVGLSTVEPSRTSNSSSREIESGRRGHVTQGVGSVPSSVGGVYDTGSNKAKVARLRIKLTRCAHGLPRLWCGYSAQGPQASAAVTDKYVPGFSEKLACTERKWCDFVSFDFRLPAHLQLFVKRFYRDDAKRRIGLRCP